MKRRGQTITAVAMQQNADDEVTGGIKVRRVWWESRRSEEALLMQAEATPGTTNELRQTHMTGATEVLLVSKVKA